MATKSNKMCNVCGKRRAYTGTGPGVETAGSHGMCNFCYTEGGHENTHNDSNHHAIAQEVAAAEAAGVELAEVLSKSGLEELAFMKDCWICHPELNLAQKPVKAKKTGAKAAYVRRPQLNHKGHSHPQTPAARRACKAAFWAFIASEGYTEANVLADHFVAWNHQCDGHGKKI